MHFLSSLDDHPTLYFHTLYILHLLATHLYSEGSNARVGYSTSHAQWSMGWVLLHDALAFILLKPVPMGWGLVTFMGCHPIQGIA